ncbi:tryptophan--tRNA ligase [Spiroplasma endosymbiont of Labia minor]|uniref:tryptophan--tRNA ligase n=1 Tax=Spiroplasma endosymbiont of Labia minor TaxID=3066305 RepID=UPI0030D04C6B
MAKEKMVTGITSTGTLTLGNYIGALRNFVKLQDQYEMYIFIANLHGITVPIDPETLRNNIKTIVALYFACGLDPNKVHIFKQSDVPAHSELQWILTTFTTLGELKRMTQFKDKSAKVKNSNGTEMIPTGLLIYPVLMAADILLYDAVKVPVGNDQKQHIELTRNIAERLNNKFNKNIFTVPEEYIPEIGAKIMGLQNPTKKMSKSSTNDKDSISMLDDEAIIRKKIASAITDSENKVYYDLINKPGVSNLLTIYASLKEISILEAENVFKDKNYGEFKTAISDIIIATLKPIQDKFKILYDSTEVKNWLASGANDANIIANKKIELIKENIGIN